MEWGKVKRKKRRKKKRKGRPLNNEASYSVQVRSPPSLFCVPFSSFHTPAGYPHASSSMTPCPLQATTTTAGSKHTTNWVFALLLLLSTGKKAHDDDFSCFCVSGSHKGREGGGRKQSKKKKWGHGTWSVFTFRINQGYSGVNKKTRM